jgi:hypothetical protein
MSGKLNGIGEMDGFLGIFLGQRQRTKEGAKDGKLTTKSVADCGWKKGPYQ